METVVGKFENNVLTISLRDRIDTTNANEVEASIHEITQTYPEGEVIIDIDDVNYISSAGLRVILRLKKERPELKIINACSEVYEVFEMTGFSEMIDVSKAYRKLSVDGCAVIGKGAKGTVYRFNDDTAIKVYNDANCLDGIKNERELAKKAFVLGIPTAIPYDIVKVGDKFGSVFELLNAKCYSQLIKEDPANIEKYSKEYADLLRQIHDTPVKKDDMPDGRKIVYKWVDMVAQYVSKEDSDKLAKMVSELPEQYTMLHCDYHTNNILQQNGETILIDMDTLSHGHPIIDIANVYVTYVGFTKVDRANVEEFLGITGDQAQEVWNYFKKYYFIDKSENEIENIVKKIELLSNARVLRHTARRDSQSDKSKAIIQQCAQEIHALLKEVNTLNF